MLTLPNVLTLARVVMVPPLVALLWNPNWHVGYLLGFALYVLLGVTDYADGYFARAWGIVSKFGTFLDPIADKIMVASVIVVLVAARVIGGWAVVAALVILLREIAVSGLREFLGGANVTLPVSQLAKWKTAAQMMALGALILGNGLDSDRVILVGLGCLWLAAALTLVTGWDYLRVGLRHMD